MDRKLETKIVKKALKQQGIKASVTHGHGTAYGWLEINIGDPADRDGLRLNEDGWSRSNTFTSEEVDLHERIIAMVQELTGRHGDYQGNILLLTQDF